MGVAVLAALLALAASTAQAQDAEQAPPGQDCDTSKAPGAVSVLKAGVVDDKTVDVRGGRAGAGAAAG